METIGMSRKERSRLEVFSRVKRGELKLSRAASLVGLSYRQAKRVYGRYREEGDGGLVHRLRGRTSNHRSETGQRERVLTCYQERYADFGPTLASEYLSREEGEAISVTTLRRWLVGAGLWQPRQRRVAHRRWRERKAQRGEMVQMDGSHHDWFEGRRPWAVLMVMIDDATNWTYAEFFEEETTVASMRTFWSYVRQWGLPRSLYVDHDSIYEASREANTDEALRGMGPLTQFGRAMKELEVRLILAHSPQAKGRVERRHGVFQDRLVKGLRLAGIGELAAANAYLREQFLPELNERFTVAPRCRADAHRRVPRPVRLERVLSFQESRVVQNDWTVAWRHRWFQLTQANRKFRLVRQRVTVCEQLDGQIRLLYRGRELAWEELPERPRSRRVTTRSEAVSKSGTREAASAARSSKPAPTHPWRGDRVCPGSLPRPRPACSASLATLAALRKPAGAAAATVP